MPDISEPDVILADGEQWKSDIELLRKLLTGVHQWARKNSRTGCFLPSCFRRQCQCKTTWIIYLCADLWCCHISRNKKYVCHAIFIWCQKFACVNSNHSILNPFVSCGEFHADIVTNLEHNQHEPVTLNLESSRTRHSPRIGGGRNQTLLTYIKI